jgi:hypothetical protein
VKRVKAKKPAPLVSIHAEGEAIRFRPDQIKRRMSSLNALRDIRVASAVWTAGRGELNENGKEVLQALHSPICTLVHAYCTDGFREEIEALVSAHMNGREPPAAKFARLLRCAAPYIPHGETLRALIDAALKGVPL